ncbi:hypothetical protein AAC03nite_31140 [Alicyclobacillus acidoterrestris]|nr:hypothetical protein AAC03nite_31140 [Alicyclobacillus acidoterrestris]
MPMAKDIMLGIVILAIIVKRQLVPRPLSGRLLILPLIFSAYAFYETAGNSTVHLAGWVSLILTFLLSLIVGFIRGHLTRVYQENGQWMVAGSWKALLFWLLSIPIRYGLRFLLVPLLGAGAAFHGQSSSLPYLFSISGLLLGRACMLALRHPEAVREARQAHLATRAARRSHRE